MRLEWIYFLLDMPSRILHTYMKLQVFI